MDPKVFKGSKAIKDMMVFKVLKGSKASAVPLLSASFAALRYPHREG
jgi:hypothetical protein